MFIASESQLKPTFRALFNQAELLLKNGKKIIVEVSEHKQKRTNEQNAYYWLFNDQLARFLKDAGLTYGEYKISYSRHIIHDINKKLYGVKSTKDMKIGEFCEYMNDLLLFWQERTHGEFAMSELPGNYLERKGYIING